MRISVARLLSDTLTLDLPRRAGGEPNRFELDHGVNVRGTLDTDDGVRLERIAADTLDLSRMRWAFGAKPLTTGALTLQSLGIDLRVPKGASAIGTINARELTALTVALVLGAEKRIQVDRLAARELAMRFIRDGLLVDVGTLDLGSGEAELGDTHVRWRGVHAQKVSFRQTEDEGLTIQVGELTVEGLSIVVERLGHGSDASSEAPEPAHPPMDWHFLDGVDGQVDIDLTVDIKVPVIKRRTATHKFRIPIHDGTIDFHAAERQLSFLEDTLIDFEVEDHRLILEKDIPLLPKDEKVIVYWPLDVDAHHLATQNLVRLRTLVNLRKPDKTAAELAEEERDNDKEKSVRLLAIDADPVAIELTLSSRATTPFRGGTLTFGRSGAEVAGRVKVAGALHYAGHGEAAAEPGELHVALEEIAVALKQVAFGHAKVSGALKGDIDDIVVRLSAFSPQHVSITTERFELTDAALSVT